ncbi:MAG: response regulator transcription factor [Alphaproteobacteria bacterium]|nr:response regulator transcription factor [Alphaproteobacteria bacterium]
MQSPHADPRVRVVPSDLEVDDLLARVEDIAELVPDDPDVTLVDVPDAPPLEEPAIALVTDLSETDRWLEAGYRAVLPRDIEPDAMLAAIRAVMAGLVVHTGATVPNRPRAPDLTPREREVLELLAQGFSNREIGEALDISSHTAKFHVQGLLDKLDATTRTEAAVRAARMLII